MGQSKASENAEKGQLLERDFADWMTSKLGYSKTELRVPVTGKVSERSYEVDIHGIKHNRLMDIVGVAGVFVAIVAAIAGYMGDPQIEGAARQLVGAFDPSLGDSALLIVGIAGAVTGIYGRTRFRTDAWVECKNQKTNVKRHQIQKVISSVEDVRAVDNPKWKPDRVIMVSGTDFDADALNFAREFGVVCYVRAGEAYETRT